MGSHILRIEKEKVKMKLLGHFLSLIVRFVQTQEQALDGEYFFPLCIFALTLLWINS